MNKKMITMVAVLLVAVTVGVFASSATDLNGSDFVRLGNLGIVSGELFEENGEWYLTSEGKEYAIHLGNYEVVYPQGIELEEGSEAVVRGFILGNDISAVKVASKDSVWNLRTEAGVPLWAGAGNRDNQVSDRNDRQGMGNYSQMSQRSNARGNYRQATQVARGSQSRFSAPGVQTSPVEHRNSQRPMIRY